MAARRAVQAEARASEEPLWDAVFHRSVRRLASPRSLGGSERPAVERAWAQRAMAIAQATMRMEVEEEVEVGEAEGEVGLEVELKAFDRCRRSRRSMRPRLHGIRRR